MSWRLTINEIDRSSTVIPVVGKTGAMVIRSDKGPMEPVYISQTDEQRIYDLFGYPSPSFPDVWNAVEFNKEAPIWVSAPFGTLDTSGGVEVTSTGTSQFASAGLTESDISSYTFGGVSDYFVLVNRAPSASEYLRVKISFTPADGTLGTPAMFDIMLQKYDLDSWKDVETYTVSLTKTAKDGFGKNIYIENVLEDNDYIRVIVNDSANVGNGFVDDSTWVTFDGSTRSSAITSTELTNGWNYFQKSRTYQAAVFMDPTTDSAVVDLFNTLRNTYQKYASYILYLPSGEDSSDAVTTKSGYSVNNRGLAFYWNSAKIRNLYGQNFWTAPVGRVGQKYVQMSNIFNGLAPSWIDENNHGGQLGTGIIELEYDPSESELETLDQNGINPIIQDPAYGFMIVSQRTAKSPTVLSDDSWIGHSRLFDYLIENIKNQVLTYQITKLNDDTHRRMAVMKGTSIADPVLASGLLNDYKIVCDLTNNTDIMRAQRKFVYTLAVQVTPFSEYIVFNFIKVGQQITVDDVA
jgi:hypothetical protein